MINDLNIKIFYDGVDIDVAKKHEKIIKGITTNPTLMRQGNITNYIEHCQLLISRFPDIPVSLEVFSDNFMEMENQAKKLSELGENVYVKIPITNTSGESSYRLIENLSKAGIPTNITAIFTADQCASIEPIINQYTPTILSIFAGRISDSGVDSKPIIKDCLWIAEPKNNISILWASCRELYNIIEAEQTGCDIITIPESILDKLHLVGKNLGEYSKETVLMFYNDAKASNYQL